MTSITGQKNIINGPKLTVRLALVVSAFLAGQSPAFPQSRSIYVTGGVGMSHTTEGCCGGTAISPGVGGKAATVAGDVGRWLTQTVGLALEVNMGRSFAVREQGANGFGMCCATLSRSHRMNGVSGVVKLRPVMGMVFLGGLSWEVISTTEVRVFTPLGGTRQAPTTSRFTSTRPAWLVGGEGEVLLASRWRLVPAVRLAVDLAETDYLTASRPLLLGRTTLRPTLSIRYNSTQ
ncbi:MAG: hypothetical protein U0163_00170 [Gemmatimonadaceae bacterium]